MTDHTPEPWTADDCADARGHRTVRRADGSPNGDTDSQPIATAYTDADGARIVACVNACAGIDDPPRAVAMLRLIQGDLADGAVADAVARKISEEIASLFR